MAEELVLICAVDVVKCRLINLQSQPLSNDPAEELKIRHMFRYHRSLIKSTFFFPISFSIMQRVGATEDANLAHLVHGWCDHSNGIKLN